MRTSFESSAERSNSLQAKLIQRLNNEIREDDTRLTERFNSNHMLANHFKDESTGVNVFDEFRSYIHKEINPGGHMDEGARMTAVLQEAQKKLLQDMPDIEGADSLLADSIVRHVKRHNYPEALRILNSDSTSKAKDIVELSRRADKQVG